MNKSWKCVFVLLTTTLLTACAFSRFDGSRTGNESQLIMEYDMQENNAESIAEEHCESITIADHEVISSEFDIDLTEDENNLEITYYDSIAKADCMILVSKNKNLALPQHEYDEALNETWEGRTVSNQNIVVNVQHGKVDSKEVLAAWEYKEYQFAIMGEAEESSDSISKTALYIINNLK